MDMHRSTLRDLSILAGILLTAIGLCVVLSGLHDDNNPFAMPLFILAVALIARLTEGYLCGIAASLIGTFCVNYMFTYPFWEFDVTLSGYPLTFVTMLIVSISISTLTTQIKQQEQLRFEADREKMHANLLRAISHDLRTPLSAILGAATALKDPRLTEADRGTLIDSIDRDAQWLVRVTENLLSVTKFTGEGVSLQKDEEVLEEIVGSAIVKYRNSPGALPVQVDMPEDILLVPMDPTLIKQLLLNLFDNVSAHAEGATGIWLKVTREPATVRIDVEDDGRGAPHHRIRALDSGMPVLPEQSRPDGHRNMGIGLSTCGSIVRAHGGEMKVYQSARGGVGIGFTLPLEEGGGSHAR